jgi:hypothetical protein
MRLWFLHLTGAATLETGLGVPFQSRSQLDHHWLATMPQKVIFRTNDNGLAVKPLSKAHTDCAAGSWSIIRGTLGTGDDAEVAEALRLGYEAGREECETVRFYFRNLDLGSGGAFERDQQSSQGGFQIRFRTVLGLSHSILSLSPFNLFDRRPGST